MRKKAMRVPDNLCEAYDYDKPVSFARGMRVDVAGAVFLFISGTASVNEKGESLYPGDIEKQTRRMFENVTALLKSEGATWQDIARTTIYIADMRNYDKLNAVRNAFYKEQGLNEFPASTCVEARLCRPELMVEMEAIAIMGSGIDI